MPNHEETVVPWHQDNSYWEPRLWDEHVLTVWISLVDSTRDNGCMQFVRGGHLSGKTAPHTVGTTTRTWYTELSEGDLMSHLLGVQGGRLPSRLQEWLSRLRSWWLRVSGATQAAPKVKVPDERIVTIEAPAGSLILFGGTTPHRSLNSVSEQIRWSTDFRLHRPHAMRRAASGRELDWFYGLKDSLTLRDGGRDYEPDWGKWAATDRTAAQDGSAGFDANALEENFDPVIIGPWMDLWNVTSHVDGGENKHIDRYLAADMTKRDPETYRRAGNW